MIVKHRVQRRYQYGGNCIFDIIGKIASKVATKTPELIAKAQASQLINKITKEAVKQGEKALVDSSGKLAKTAINKVVDKIVYKKSIDNRAVAKQNVNNLINGLTAQKSTTSDHGPTANLNSLISGMGLKKVSGSGIILD